MKYFLCFAVLLLAGFINAIGSEPFGKIDNTAVSDPHLIGRDSLKLWEVAQVELHLQNSSLLYTVTISSEQTGPFCTGAFLSVTVVITAASCVIGRALEDLRVNFLSAHGSQFISASVLDYEVHPLFRPERDEYNLIGLRVNTQSIIPKRLHLLDPRKEDEILKGRRYIMYIPRYNFDATDIPHMAFHRGIYEVRTTYNLSSGQCAPENQGTEESLICVYRRDLEPFSIPFLGEGTPLILFTKENAYFYGLDGNNSPEEQKAFTFQAARGNYDFLLEILYDM